MSSLDRDNGPKSSEERIAAIQATPWVGYSRALAILDDLEDVFNFPPTHRMPNRLVVGKTGNGKTEILERFCELHPPYSRAIGNVVIPVLYVQAPDVPDERRLYSGIRYSLMNQRALPPHAVELPALPRRLDEAQYFVLDALQKYKVQVLIIDEIQHLLAGNGFKQRQFRNTIKYIGNMLRTPIVAAGIFEAYAAIQTDPQLVSRFMPLELPSWRYGREYRDLLSSLEAYVALNRTSALAAPDLAAKLLAMSEGTIGDLVDLLQRAAVAAIRSSREQIDAPLLDSLGYIRPSQRGGFTMGQ